MRAKNIVHNNNNDNGGGGGGDGDHGPVQLPPNLTCPRKLIYSTGANAVGVTRQPFTQAVQRTL